MRRRIVVAGITVAFAALAVGLCFLYARWQSQRLRVAGLESWVSAQVPQLLSFRPDDNSPALKLVRQDGYWGTPQEDTPFYNGIRGLIRLTSGNWIYFSGFSSHGSGNLILAIDSEGHLWACNGHICPSLDLHWSNRPLPEELSLEDFRASRVTLAPGENGSETWRLVDDWKDRPFKP